MFYKKINATLKIISTQTLLFEINLCHKI